MIKQNIGSHTRLDQPWDWNITEKWFSIHKPSSIHHPTCVVGQVLVNSASPAGVRTDTPTGDPNRASAASPSTCRVSGTTVPGSRRERLFPDPLSSGAFASPETGEFSSYVGPLMWSCFFRIFRNATNTHDDQSIRQPLLPSQP
jgi:hypothetical protein